MRNRTTNKNAQQATSCIKHLAVSGLSSVSARIKSSCKLIDFRFEMPNVSYTQTLWLIVKKNEYDYYERNLNTAQPLE